MDLPTAHDNSYPSLFLSTQIRKRKAICLFKKKQIIDASVNKSVSELSLQFQLPTSTIRKILSIRDKVQQAIDEGRDAKRAKLTGSRNPELDLEVRRWLQTMREQNVPVNGPELKVKPFNLTN